jgi:hypothetical protein
MRMSRMGLFVTSENRAGIPAERLKRAFAWMDDAKDVPKDVALAKDATLWLASADHFREEEEESIENGSYGRRLGEYRKDLTALIADGERIICSAKEAGIERFPAGFTLDDFEAAVESVRVTFRCEHAPENTPAVNGLIEKLLLHLPSLS